MEGARNLSTLMKELKIDRYPQEITEIYHTAETEFRMRGVDIVKEEYLKELNDKYALFSHQFEVVLKAARKIADNKALLCFIYLLRAIIKDKTNGYKMLSALELPIGGKERLEYDLVPVFVFISFAESMSDILVQRGVPKDIIDESMRACEKSMDVFEDRFGYPGMNKAYLQWLCPYMEGRRLDIGRFNFDVIPCFGGGVTVFQNRVGERKILINNAQIHCEGHLLGAANYEDNTGSFVAMIEEKEDYWRGYAVNEFAVCEKCLTELKKSEWQIVLQETDSVIGVHIPGKNGKSGKKNFTKELRECSYAKAWEIFNRCYGEYQFKAFVCSSWMMDSQLKVMLGETSNLVGFQSEFLLFPQLRGDGNVMSFVYGKNFNRYEELPEDTKLKKAIKMHYLNNKVIYKTGGIHFQE